MHMNVFQGDILKFDGKSVPMLVVSNDRFNESGQAICCPIDCQRSSNHLHAYIEGKNISGEVYCEQVLYLDLSQRSYKKIDEVGLSTLMVVSDIIQGIVDYI